MGMSGGGGGQSQTQTKTQQQLPGWEQEPAKAYLASLMSYILPGSTVPSSWFGTKGFSFPTSGGSAGSAGGSAGGAAGGGVPNQYAAGQVANEIDPTGANYAMFAPMIAGSPFLQNIAATNPNAIVGATSPMASSQFGNQNIYGSANAAQNPLSAIQGFTPTPIPQSPLTTPQAAPPPPPPPAPAPAPAPVVAKGKAKKQPKPKTPPGQAGYDAALAALKKA